ncbi:MAG: hypothetical protein HYV76_02010 [Candidatus Vogelbacteria bacterium]|nr:hypothetical protein [Candidatus Vogelbacteria bacterium]
MKKGVLYLIPGLGESTRLKSYQSVIKQAKQFGLIVVPVNIKWQDNKTMDNFVSQVDAKIPDHITNDYILGFSFGAYISAILSDKKQAKGYIFCSLSPYFKDDLKFIPVQSKKYFGLKMMNSFKKYSFPKKITGKVWFLIGSQEWPLAINRTKEYAKSLSGNSTIKIVSDAGHDLSNTKYLQKIGGILKKL